MPQQQSWWDLLEESASREQVEEQEDKERARRQTFKKLRASGHWLTLLHVARTIAQPFTLNDISVAVWKACPDFFGMKGYPYPDNHKVHYILYGDRGLIAKKLIERVSQGLFRIPEAVDLATLSANQEHSTELQSTNSSAVCTSEAGASFIATAVSDLSSEKYIIEQSTELRKS